MDTTDIIPVFVSMNKLTLCLVIASSIKTKKKLISHTKIMSESGILMLLRIECVYTHFKAIMM